MTVSGEVNLSAATLFSLEFEPKRAARLFVKAFYRIIRVAPPEYFAPETVTDGQI